MTSETSTEAWTIEITEAAATHARRMREKEGHPAEAILRVGVKGGGCSGFSYHLDYTTETHPEDILIEKDGFTFAVDPKSLKFLHGMVLDFSGGLMGQGFVFRNPNAKASCGCGKSFAV